MTRLTLESYSIPAADLGPENPLPLFRDPNANRDVKIDATVPDDDRRYMGWETGFRVLPHRMQDGYNRNRHMRHFRAAVLENEFLRATFLPELGGRLVSLVHKPAARELLERNPVFQPANLALRNAWFSGGVEWNTAVLGHYYLTCSPVFAARVKGSQGDPVLRIYEWDRVRCFPWQIDFHLPPGSPFLFSRVRLVNPHEREMPNYWWSNIAVAQRPDVRTLAPADSALCGTEVGIGLAQLPEFPKARGEGAERRDMTYATQIPCAWEMFFRIPDGQRPWVAALDASGRGLVQASTARLRGRKMFVWGSTQGSRRWQEYLAAPGCAYLEIQAGLARTQLESLPMPPLAQWTWTEAYGLLEADAAAVHNTDWNAAWRAADAVLNERLPQAELDARDARFAAVTARAPDEVFFRGSGWGALERRRLAAQRAADRIPPELVFDNLGPDQEPWLALLEKRALPDRDWRGDPGQFMVQDEWRALLDRSLSSGGGNWLAWWHLGNARYEAQDRDGARAAWQESLKRQRTAWALRNLALTESPAAINRPPVFGQDPARPTAATVELMRQGWEAGPQTAALAIEYARMLLQATQYKELRRFARALPEDMRANERIQLLAARAALELGALRDVAPLFKREFATIREGEVSLTDLWFSYHERRLAKRDKCPLDEALRERVRREYPPPPRIDFRAGPEKKK